MRDFSKYQGIFPAFYACYEQEGGVRAPLLELAPEDQPIAEEAARMIAAAIGQYC